MLIVFQQVIFLLYYSTKVSLRDVITVMQFPHYIVKHEKRQVVEPVSRSLSVIKLEVHFCCLNFLDLLLLQDQHDLR